MKLRTVVAVLLGFLGVGVICSVTYFNDYVLRQTHFVGNLLPLSVYGTLILFLLFINPLLAKVRNADGDGFSLNGKQFVLILAMVLAVASIPGSGLMRLMNTVTMLPHHYVKMDVGWQRHEIIASTPSQMLADPGENDAALMQFVQGMKRGDQSIRLRDIPWSAWAGTMRFWIPLVLMVYAGFFGLALVLHRQWSEHEQLPYPLAKFAMALLPAKDGDAKGAVLGNKLFWMGCGLVLAIHAINYLAVWFPGMVRIPTIYNFSSVAEAFGAHQPGGAYNFRIFFSVIAISYFLASDVGLSLGLAPMVYPFIRAIFVAQGVPLTIGGHRSPERVMIAGAFVGMFCSILYTGRHYYMNALRKAFGRPGSKEVKQEAVWGMRVFLLAMVSFVFWLSRVGLDWQLGVILAIFITVLYVVASRVVAETGLFFFQAFWLPAGAMVALLGARAMGPEATIIVFLVSIVLLMDPREAFMPFIVSALKLLEDRRVKFSTGTAWMSTAMAVGLAIAVVATLFYQYNYGAMGDGWGAGWVPRIAFNETVSVKQRLDAQGTLAESLELSGWGRLASISPEDGRLFSFALGIVLVLAFTAGRLRFAKWPLHPVFFLVFASYTGTQFAFSFLFGWFIKSMVTKYGGEKAYHGIKPLMFGLIAGDMLGGFIPIIIGFIYYRVTGELPMGFRVLPS
jgi:hypothetical protein